MEQAFGTLMAALDGANLIHDIGYLGQGLLGNPAMIVMCAEMISYIEQLMAGFDIEDDALALDAIHAVGPGGNYLLEEHTLRHFRSAQWRPQFFNRANPQAWEEQGRKRYEQKVIEKTLDILAKHAAEPLLARLDALEKEAEETLEGIDFAA